MYRVHHIFPHTGEWACIEVDTLDQAEMWYDCKSKARNIVRMVLTLCDPNGHIIKQETLGE